MKRRSLGATAVSVTELGFGGAPIGNLLHTVEDDVAFATVEAAWDGGMRYFDTAPHYGLGLSERRLGTVLAGKPRAEYTLSTKVGRLLVPNPSPTGSDLAGGGFAVPDDLVRERDYSRDGVLRSLDSSLRRLGLDRVDVVYVHDPEAHLETALAEALPALADLRDQGVIGAIGAGMNVVEPLRRIVAEADVDVIMVAGRYTLLDRSAVVLLDECLARGVSFVAAAPFNSGLLAQAWPVATGRFDYAPAPGAVLARAREFAAVCSEFGVELPHAAIQFPARHPAVAAVVAGMVNSGQVSTDLEWWTAPVPAELWAALDAVPAWRSLPT